MKLLVIMGSIPIICILIIVLGIKVKRQHFMDACRDIKDNAYGLEVKDERPM